MRIALSILLIFSALHTIASAQISAQDSVILRIKAEFDKGNFNEAKNIALEALHSKEAYSEDDLFQIHQYLAFVYVARGELENAIKDFKEALKIKPDHRYDPRKVSPKIVDVFQQALEEYQTAQEYQKKEHKFSYIKLEAGAKSLIFPGLGQLHKGQKTKGYILMGAESVSIAALALSQWQFMKAHDEYKQARMPGDIENKYREYNAYYKIRNLSAVAVGVIYVYSFLDCLYTAPSIESDSFTIQITPAGINAFISF